MSKPRLNFNPDYHIAWLLVLIITTVPRITLGLDLLGGWKLDPTFSLGTEYANNPLLMLDAKEAGLVTTPVAGMLLRRHEERWQANIAARLDYTIFTGLDVPNIDNQRFELNSNFQVTEKTSLAFNAGYLRDNLIRRVPIFGDDFVVDPFIDIEDVDIGLVDFTLRRNRLRLMPSWTYEFTERSTVAVRYTFLDISFEDPPEEVPIVPVDTQANRIEASALYRLTPEALLTLDVNALQVTSEDIQTDVLGFLVGLEYPLSERLQINPRIGYRIASTEVNGEEEKTGGFLGQLMVGYQTELGQFQGVVARIVNPAGRGRANQTDRVALQYFLSIRPRLGFSLGVDGFITEPLGFEFAEERGWLEARSGLTWNWTRWWAVEAGYAYRRRSVGDFANDSHGIYAGITYTPPRPGQ